ncbi:hypothetical protein JHK87_016852 [Glycine soja]|nr:hypothetical protein JHK87_016852 [Glycine soja]
MKNWFTCTDRRVAFDQMWWRDGIGLPSKLSFARDRLVEAFSWSLAMFPQPQFNNCHKEITKVGILITFLDDVYDIYGTLGELELFTNAVESDQICARHTSKKQNGFTTKSFAIQRVLRKCNDVKLMWGEDPFFRGKTDKLIRP